MSRVDYKELEKSLFVDFESKLKAERFWHVLPEGETDIASAEFLFDSTTGLLYTPVSKLLDHLSNYNFLNVTLADDSKTFAGLQTDTLLLWSSKLSENNVNLSDAREVLTDFTQLGLLGWKLPTKDQLYSFARKSGNPYRVGQNYRLDVGGTGVYSILTMQGRIDVDAGCWGEACAYTSGYLYAVQDSWSKLLLDELIVELANKQLKLIPPRKTCEALEVKANDAWSDKSAAHIIAQLRKKGYVLKSEKKDGQDVFLRSLDFSFYNNIKKLDYTPCRLPELEDVDLYDIEKGLWEFWGQDKELLKQHNLIARDPMRDVRSSAVAIDFGTSSTVVAMDTPSGARELLRIGVRDFYQEVQPSHFENPTVLEFLDYESFASAWQRQAYRPQLNWDWLRASHEAQESYRDNPGNTEVLASILPKLKQWALRSSEHHRVRLTGRKGAEIKIPHHSERNPNKGEALKVSAGDPLDPIELYAWYLGMAINWRGRGLFLKYYLSFPVKYPLEVKNRILGSFRRGLQRSLPYSLIEHHPQVLNSFEVSDLASEPAGYAAAAMRHLGIEPTDEGVPYAVFDFGGGTTDFDYGLLRWATDEEEDSGGYERVFEHLASAGDNYLGGENLLEHLVYESFKGNLDVLRTQKVQFTQPIDALPFAGSEMFLAQTQAAQTNSVMLASKLRPFMEGEDGYLPSQLKLDLLNTQGEKVSCELVLDATQLDDILSERIYRGLHAFLCELKALLPELPKAEIQILLAGNGCRSRHLQALLAEDAEPFAQLCEEVFGEDFPDFCIHEPLPMDEDNPHAPTAKTGVALGLLQVAPGENTLLLNRVRSEHEGQAPFGWFVGKMRRGKFEPVLDDKSVYGQWQEIGILQQGVFNLFFTNSPRARNGMSEGDPELRKSRKDFPAAGVGARLYIRTKSPHCIELTTAVSVSELEENPKIEQFELT